MMRTLVPGRTEGRELQWNVGADRKEAHLRHDRALGETRHAEEVLHLASSSVQPARTVEQHAGRAHRATGRAERGPTGTAVLAAAAASSPKEDDVVAWLDARHMRADLFHDPGTFVTKDGWQGRGEIATHEMPVAVADAGGGDPHKHFAGARRIEDEIFDLERGARRMEYGGLHSNIT